MPEQCATACGAVTVSVTERCATACGDVTVSMPEHVHLAKELISKKAYHRLLAAGEYAAFSDSMCCNSSIRGDPCHAS